MARLNSEQVQELIKRPKNGDYVRLAALQEQRLSFHVDVMQERRQLERNKAYQNWIEWVRTLLPKDKMEKFEKLVSVPVPTNQITESIFTELSKVFEAQNSQRKAMLTDKSLQADAEDFLQRTGFQSFMATRGWDAVKTKVNGFMVVDLPREQTTLRPEPYVYFLNLSLVHDVEINNDRKVEYIIFRQNNETLVVIDDEFYRVFKKADSTSDWQAFNEVPHSFYSESGELIDGLGYAPVTSLFPNSTDISSHIDKQGPITNILSDLDWYLFKLISYRYLGLYGDYPIMVTYRETCDYRNEQGAICEGGRVAYEYEVGNELKTRFDKCPVCEGRKVIGPGSFWTVDPPRDAGDVDLMKDPIKIVEISNDKLVFGAKALQDLEDRMFLNCVGYDGEPENNQAKNEKQVASSFESRQAILERLKLVLEEAEEFLWDTAFIMRYGRVFYTGSVINYGNKFYLQTVEEVNKRYIDAKAAGKPMYELAALRKLANLTQNRHNPDEMQRTEILDMLEPWADLSIQQIQSMGLQNTDIINYFVKLNFNSYVSRFERENMDIVEFGSKTSLSNKIETILSKLKDYAKEQIESSRIVSPGYAGNQDPANDGR